MAHQWWASSKEIKPKLCRKRGFAALPKSIHTNHSRNNHNSLNINSFLFQTVQEKEKRPISNALHILLSLCCVKTVENKLVFINCPVHRQDPNKRTACPKEIRGANVCTIAKEEIQKISGAILFSSQQPANTYSRSANLCALIKKKNKNPEDWSDFWKIYFNTGNIFFSFKCSPKPDYQISSQFPIADTSQPKLKNITKKKKKSQKYNNHHKRELISFFRENKKVYLSQKLHCLVTFISLLFWR